MGPGLRPWYPTQAVLLSQIDVERPEETLPNIIEKGVKCCSSNLLGRCAFEIVRQMSVSCLSLSKISVGWAGKAGQTFRGKDEDDISDVEIGDGKRIFDFAVPIFPRTCPRNDPSEYPVRKSVPIVT